MQKKLNILIAYNVVLSVCFLFFFLFAFTSNHQKTKFKEIDVERINIIEKDGTPKLVISNKERQPTGLTINGKTYEYGRGKSGGILLYNDLGEENSGFLFGGNQQEHGLSLTFDQYKQDQVLALRSQETVRNGRKEKLYGLALWNRPDTIEMEQFLKQDQRIKQIPDEKTRQAEYERLNALGYYGQNIFFAGRLWNGNTGVFINDSKGQKRIRLYVDINNNPKLEFFDETGKNIPVDKL